MMWRMRKSRGRSHWDPFPVLYELTDQDDRPVYTPKTTAPDASKAMTKRFKAGLTGQFHGDNLKDDDLEESKSVASVSLFYTSSLTVLQGP